MVATIHSVNIHEDLNEIICAKHLPQCLENGITISYYFSWVWITKVCGRTYQGEAALFLPLTPFFSEVMLDFSFQMRELWEQLILGPECAVIGLPRWC